MIGRYIMPCTLVAVFIILGTTAITSNKNSQPKNEKIYQVVSPSPGVKCVVVVYTLSKLSKPVNCWESENESGRPK